MLDIALGVIIAVVVLCALPIIFAAMVALVPPLCWVYFRCRDWFQPFLEAASTGLWMFCAVGFWANTGIKSDGRNKAERNTDHAGYKASRAKAR